MKDYKKAKEHLKEKFKDADTDPMPEGLQYLPEFGQIPSVCKDCEDYTPIFGCRAFGLCHKEKEK